MRLMGPQQLRVNIVLFFSNIYKYHCGPMGRMQLFQQDKVSLFFFLFLLVQGLDRSSPIFPSHQMPQGPSCKRGESSELSVPGSE